MAEFLPTKGRGFVLIIYQGFFSFGAMLGAGLGWIVLEVLDLHWRFLVVVSVLPVSIVFCFFPFLPESVRWLSIHQRGEEAVQTLQRVAKWNGKALPEHAKIVFVVPKEEESVKKSNFLSQTVTLFKVASLRKMTLILALLWFVGSLNYYGLVFITPPFFEHLEISNLYLLSFITSFADLPFLLFFGWLSRWFGRKKLLIAAVLLNSIFTMLLLVPVAIADVVFLFIARGAIAATFALVYVFTIEVFCCFFF
jgi:MFS family permease